MVAQFGASLSADGIYFILYVMRLLLLGFALKFASRNLGANIELMLQVGTESQPWQLGGRAIVSRTELEWSAAPAALMQRTVTNSGARFSAHSQERQTILSQRRAALIERNRR